jgi:hypothetical protein
MTQIVDRTRAMKPMRGKQPLRYEVALYHTERDWEQETPAIVAKFAHCGDAFLYAKTINEPLFCIAVRN